MKKGSASTPSPASAPKPTPLELFEAAKLLGIELVTPGKPFEPNPIGAEGALDASAMGVTYFSRELRAAMPSMSEQEIAENERDWYLREKLTFVMGAWAPLKRLLSAAHCLTDSVLKMLDGAPRPMRSRQRKRFPWKADCRAARCQVECRC